MYFDDAMEFDVVVVTSTRKLQKIPGCSWGMLVVQLINIKYFDLENNLPKNCNKTQ